MQAWLRLKSALDLLKRKRSKIIRRLAIYLVIMLMLFPVVFMYRVDIYRNFLSRFDDWEYSIRPDGIPITDYGVQANVYVGEQITIRTVANGGIYYHEQMMDGNATAGIYFNNTVDWILEHRNEFQITTENSTKTLSNWPYDFAIYDLPVGWVSGMVDAKALHVLALAYDTYGNTTYLDIVDQVANTFETSVALGGNLLVLDDGTSWYPEIVISPSLIPNYEPPLILNGFMFALDHIYKANQVFNNSRLADIFNLGIISAQQNLHLYDSPYDWTLYHLDYPQKLASRGYHQIHINLCHNLYNYTNITVFDEYATLWETYSDPPSFTIEELLSPEFITNGLLMASLIFFPLLAIDISQTLIRRGYRNRKGKSPPVDN